MHHLPRPNGATCSGDELRNQGTKLLRNLHDGIPKEAFEEYPVKRGFPKGDLEAGTFTPDYSQQAAALVQNWLFFGLLEEVFHISVPTRDFTKTDGNGEHFLSTQLLGDYVERWRE